MKCIAWHEIDDIEVVSKGRGQYMLRVKPMVGAQILFGTHLGTCGMGDNFEIDIGDVDRREAEDEADDYMRQVRNARIAQKQQATA